MPEQRKNLESEQRKDLLRPSVDWIILSTVGLLVLAVLYTLYFARPIFLPLALAALLAFTLWPVQKFLRRLHIPAFIAATIVLAVLVAAVIGIVYPLAKPAANWLAELPRGADELRWKLSEISKPIEKVQEVVEQVEEVGQGIANGGGQQEYVPKVQIDDSAMSEALLKKSREMGVTLGLAGGFLFFFLAFGQALARPFSPESRTLALVHQIGSSISSYLFVVTAINIGLGVCVGLALHLLGMPNAMLWGLMATIANFIPYIGAIVGETVVLFVAMMTFDNLWQIILPPLAYFIINTIEGTFVTPIILGKRFTINPIIVFLALALWGWMWGVIGAFIAVPILMGFKIFCDHFEPLSKLGQFMSLEEQPSFLKRLRRTWQSMRGP